MTPMLLVRAVTGFLAGLFQDKIGGAVFWSAAALWVAVMGKVIFVGGLFSGVAFLGLIVSAVGFAGSWVVGMITLMFYERIAR